VEEEMIIKNESKLSDWTVADTLARLPLNGGADYTITVRQAKRGCFAYTRFDKGQVHVYLPRDIELPYTWASSPTHEVHTQIEALLYLTAHELFHINLMKARVLSEEGEELAADKYGMRAVRSMRRRR
jgi:hypothetical protein